MRFAWDEKKAASNLVKHGISFDEAAPVFGDPLSNTFRWIVALKKLTNTSLALKWTKNKTQVGAE